MNYKSVRIGAELLARMQAIADLYGATVNCIARKAVIRLDRLKRDGVELPAIVKNSTRRDGGTVCKVETDYDPGVVRAGIEAYIDEYEATAPEPAKPLPERVRYEIKEYARNCGKVEEMTARAQLEALQGERKVIDLTRGRQ